MRLFLIIQTCLVVDYVSEFEDLSAQVPGLVDHHLEQIFYIGLNQKMNEVIRMKEPQGLSNYIPDVLKMESSTFCRVLGDATKVESRQQRAVVSNNVRTVGYHNNNQKAVVLDLKSQEENIPPSKSFQRPRQCHSDAELDAMRRHRLCFKCGDKWSKSHEAVCPKKEFHTFTVLNSFEMELVKDKKWRFKRSYTLRNRSLKLCLLGIDTPKTINLRGRVGSVEVTVMIDSEASLNFISPKRGYI